MSRTLNMEKIFDVHINCPKGCRRVRAFIDDDGWVLLQYDNEKFIKITNFDTVNHKQIAEQIAGIYSQELNHLPIQRRHCTGMEFSIMLERYKHESLD